MAPFCAPRFVLQELALDAVRTVTADLGGGAKEIDIKNYAKVEKIPGGTIEDCRVLKGESAMFIWGGSAQAPGRRSLGYSGILQAKPIGCLEGAVGS